MWADVAIVVWCVGSELGTPPESAAGGAREPFAVLWELVGAGGCVCAVLYELESVPGVGCFGGCGDGGVLQWEPCVDRGEREEGEGGALSTAMDRSRVRGGLIPWVDYGGGYTAASGSNKTAGKRT